MGNVPRDIEALWIGHREATNESGDSFYAFASSSFAFGLKVLWM
jgi:hypothetical protein